MTQPLNERKTVPLTVWTKDGKFVDPHTEGAERNVIGTADVSETGVAYLTVNEPTNGGFADALIRDDMMSFSIDDTSPDFPDELPVRFTPAPGPVIWKKQKNLFPPPIHPAALPGCTCPWNNGFPVKGHHIACPYLKGHHDPEDDCGEHGHNNKE